jgi:hypothetical protein
MTTVKGRRFVLTAVVLLVVVTWFGIREYRCKVRGAVLARQVESIKRDAAREIRVGASKAEVGGFFEQHNIPLEFLETEAYGSLRTVGCAPFGCGTDRAFISVQVKLDATGTVTEAPRVVGMYQDCL